MRETELFIPVARWLEGQGYQVSAEAGQCDIVARRVEDSDSDQLILVELKVRMSLDLIIQAVRRKEISESVYVAVPLQGSKGHLRNTRGILALLRRLEVGLLIVRFLRNTTRVEVLLHPVPVTPRQRPARRARIIREIDGRYAEFDSGGQPGNVPRLTAYRQKSIHVARLLQAHGTCSPRELRAAGAPEETPAILRKNAYGWFDRPQRGVYELSAAGVVALRQYTIELPGTI
jgi:hypothetical protein